MNAGLTVEELTNVFASGINPRPISLFPPF